MTGTKNDSTKSPAASSTTFAPSGVGYFFVLNDECDIDHLRRQLEEYAAAGAESIVLHPRPGLLLPYGSDAWFDCIRNCVNICLELGLVPWLYDEDPYPSGHYGGWIVKDHPEWQAMGIERFEVNLADATDDLFVFPSGKLLWAGILPPADQHDGQNDAMDKAIEVTHQVGMVRRFWEVSPWDSRWYYPSTPLYPCPRSDAYGPEFSIKLSSLPAAEAGSRLVAFVARPAGGSSAWQALIDSLNPDATDEFIRRTHDRYRDVLGEAMLAQIPAMFTDEPKSFHSRPYTPGMFESFEQRCGYDLRQRLEHLFTQRDDPHIMRTRVDFADWVGQRFRDAWVSPVSKWCSEHNLALVGHISPEDDPVQQVPCLGNLMPMYKDFALPGIDLIIPATGDREHAILNVGVATANAVAQQACKPTVMSETLGASDNTIEPSTSALILAWQAVMGVGKIVIHGGFSSTLGLRLFDAPPDLGPCGPRWDVMRQLILDIKPLCDASINATQDAPVAILWPIRTFQTQPAGWRLHSDVRDRFNQLLLACLEAQVGVHVIDEVDLVAANVANGQLTLGRASYQTILIPDIAVLDEATFTKLQALPAAGVNVIGTSRDEIYQRGGGTALVPTKPFWDIIPGSTIDDWATWCRQTLPCCARIAGDDLQSLRATRWTKDGMSQLLMVNLCQKAIKLTLDSQPVTIPPRGAMRWERSEAAAAGSKAGDAGSWTLRSTLDPAALPTHDAPPAGVRLHHWEARLTGQPSQAGLPVQTGWCQLDYPVPAHALSPMTQAARPAYDMCLLGAAAMDGQPVADLLTYRVKLDIPQSLMDNAEGLAVRLEPTSQRGQLELRLGKHSRSARMRDTQYKPTVLVWTAEELRDALKGAEAGNLVLNIDVIAPQPFDGVKASPWITTRVSEAQAYPADRGLSDYPSLWPNGKPFNVNTATFRAE